MTHFVTAASSFFTQKSTTVFCIERDGSASRQSYIPLTLRKICNLGGFLFCSVCWPSLAQQWAWWRFFFSLAEAERQQLQGWLSQCASWETPFLSPLTLSQAWMPHTGCASAAWWLWPLVARRRTPRAGCGGVSLAHECIKVKALLPKHFTQVLDVCTMVKPEYWELKEVALFLVTPGALSPDAALGLYVRTCLSSSSDSGWLYRGCVHSSHPSEAMPLQECILRARVPAPRPVSIYVGCISLCLLCAPKAPCTLNQKSRVSSALFAVCCAVALNRWGRCGARSRYSAAGYRT